MKSNLHTEVSYYIREHLSKRVSIAEFASWHSVCIPENIDTVKKRIALNYSAMFGNYAIFIGTVLCIYLVMHLRLIVPAGACAYLIYKIVESDSDTVEIVGKRMKKEYVMAAAVCIPVVFFVVFPNMLVSMCFALFMGIVLSLVHMALSKPLVHDEEV